MRYTARHRQAPVDKDALLASLQVRSLYDTLPKGVGAAAALPPAGGMSPPGAGAVQQKVKVVGGGLTAEKGEVEEGEGDGGDKEALMTERMVATQMRSPPVAVGGGGQRRALRRG